MQKRSSLLKKCSFSSVLLLGGSLLLSSVAQAIDYGYGPNPYTSRQQAYNPYARQQATHNGSAWWRPDILGGAPHIKIVLSEQKAYFYKGGRLAGVSPVSSGMAGHRTPTGNFRISQKKMSHRSTLYGHYVSPRGYVMRSNVNVRRHRRPAGAVFRGASMDYMMRFKGAYTMHAGYVPGYPASHGCVRLPWHMAKTFFSNATVGTKVTIVP